MHEFSLIAGLMYKIESIARALHSRKISGVKVRLGALSHLSADHFREHFIHAAKRTVAEGARLDIEVMKDTTDRHAHEIVLEGVEVEY
jgi:hydrogenase nickel incorporation protein HypA/HybF